MTFSDQSKIFVASCANGGGVGTVPRQHSVPVHCKPVQWGATWYAHIEHMLDLGERRRLMAEESHPAEVNSAVKKSFVEFYHAYNLMKGMTPGPIVAQLPNVQPLVMNAQTVRVRTSPPGGAASFLSTRLQKALTRSGSVQKVNGAPGPWEFAAP